MNGNYSFSIDTKIPKDRPWITFNDKRDQGNRLVIQLMGSCPHTHDELSNQIRRIPSPSCAIIFSVTNMLPPRCISIVLHGL